MFWGLIMSFWIGNLMLLVLNIPLIGVWVRMLRSLQVLYPAILMFVCIGVYSVNNSFDVWMVLLFGLLGYLMRCSTFAGAAAPGLRAGPLMEENLRRALLISRGDFMVFLERPISALAGLGVLVLLPALFRSPANCRAPKCARC
jgi:putative tricarboxylic transport membrane protein